MFELASRSAKKPRKARNGDQVLTRETEDGTALLVLADGIGGRPCDWKASDVACEGPADTLEERSGTLDERLEAGVEAAHRRVQKETGQCEGMLAALVALAWEPEAEEVSFIGVPRLVQVSADARTVALGQIEGHVQPLLGIAVEGARV
jgi:serine/threonine protein phosphatase PrpC